eukprot:3408603-Pleurochrysis_carterae.AAC.1
MTKYNPTDGLLSTRKRNAGQRRPGDQAIPPSANPGGTGARRAAVQYKPAQRVHLREHCDVGRRVEAVARADTPAHGRVNFLREAAAAVVAVAAALAARIDCSTVEHAAVADARASERARRAA